MKAELLFGHIFYEYEHCSTNVPVFLSLHLLMFVNEDSRNGPFTATARLMAQLKGDFLHHIHCL